MWIDWVAAGLWLLQCAMLIRQAGMQRTPNEWVKSDNPAVDWTVSLIVLCLFSLLAWRSVCVALGDA